MNNADENQTQSSSEVPSTPGETIPATGSKMGAEPQALPDDPVAPANHGMPTSAGPVAKGLRASEMIESQSPGGAPGTVKGDTPSYGEVPTILDQERKAPDLSRTQ